MAGHSKWSTIKRAKAKNDAANSKVFTKLGRELQVAVKEGGADPSNNAKLKNLITKCRSYNMSNDNIQRSIKRASGEGSAVNYEFITYEGYGPAGAAVIVHALTDNKNRTAGEVRHYFDKYGGSLGATNCVAYLFSKKGVIIVLKNDKFTDDDIINYTLESGADDAEICDTYYEITTSPENFEAVKEYFETNNIPTENAEIDFIPASYVKLEEDNFAIFEKLLDAFENNDDIQEIYHNVEMPEVAEEE